MNKAELRSKILSEREALGAGEVSHRSKQIYDIFLKSFYPFCQQNQKKINQIGFYYSIRGEVDIRLFFDFFQKNKSKCAFPKIVQKNIQFHEISKMSELALSQWGIAEPVSIKPPFSNLDLIFIPAIAFDLNKNRLGYGGGYYDRFIQGLVTSGKRNSTLLVGLCYNFQLVENLETLPQDQKVDLILTQDRMLS